MIFFECLVFVSLDQASTTVETDTAAETNTSEEPVLTKTIDEEGLKLLRSRQQEYKIAAVAWKKAGNMKEALQCVSLAKRFDIVISAVNAGETVDLTDMPPPPSTPGLNTATPSSEASEKTENEMQTRASADTIPAGKFK